MPRSRRYHHGNLRQVLLEAAAAVAAADGVHAIRIKDLAVAAGVSAAAPHRHFKTRADLLVAAAETAAERQIAARDAALAGISDPVAQAQAVAIAYVRWAVAEPGWFRLLSQPDLVARSPRLQAQAQAARALLATGLGQPEAAPADPALAARSANMLAAQALVYGLARMLVDGHLGEVSPDRAAALARQLTDVLGDGMGAATPRGPATD